MNSAPRWPQALAPDNRIALLFAAACLSVAFGRFCALGTADTNPADGPPATMMIFLLTLTSAAGLAFLFLVLGLRLQAEHLTLGPALISVGLVLIVVLIVAPVSYAISLPLEQKGLPASTGGRAFKPSATPATPPATKRQTPKSTPPAIPTGSSPSTYPARNPSRRPPPRSQTG